MQLPSMSTPSQPERVRKAVFVQRSFLYGFSLSAIGTAIGLGAEYLGGRSLAKLAIGTLTLAGFVSLAWHARKEAARLAAEAEEQEPQ